jgi:pimeloyl-ACP methyl ester carboxylesterase
MLGLLCAVLPLASPAGAAARPPTLAFGACLPTQVVHPAAGLQCATLDVPFDRADPAVGDIALAVQRVPASAPRAGVIVLLAGGPGQPALPAFEELLAPLARDPALRGFELVAFDQRGTGQSEELQCPAEGQLKRGPSAYFSACGTALGPTRSYYTSQESVEDLDSLREALGGTPLSLFAVSYGTRVAGMYAREHPEGVARMVLDSLTPTTGPDPLGLARLHALRRVLDEGICGAGACRSFSSDVYGDLTRLVAVLRRHPLHTRIYDQGGRLHQARVTEKGVLSLLFGLDLAPLTRELVPAAIAAAARGYAAPLAQLTAFLQPEAPGSSIVATSGLAPTLGAFGDQAYAATQAPASDSLISISLFAATSCIEDLLPWSPESPPSGRASTLHTWLASRGAGATAPFSPATALAASSLPLCLAWPATPPAPPSPTGVSATPTLILSGDDDLRTPYEQVLANAAAYSDMRLLRIPDVGHSTVTSDPTGCAENAMIGFLASGQAPASCPPSSEAQALALAPSSLVQVAPAASRSRVAGQVATAAAITLEDLLGQIGPSGGGLRGGDWKANARGVALHDMIDVPGVELSGTVHIKVVDFIQLHLTGRLTVRGRLTGKLALHDRTLTGRVGGAQVRARLAAL